MYSWGQKKRFKESLKASLKTLGFDFNSWESLAPDRPAWRSSLISGACTAELKRTADAETKRAARKARAAFPSTSAPTHVSHVWTYFPGPDWPHQSPSDPQLPLFLLTWGHGRLLKRRTNITQSLSKFVITLIFEKWCIIT